MTGRFHIAFATRDLEKAKKFYGDFLACSPGRSGLTWIDYDFYSHQLTIQLVNAKQQNPRNYFHPKTMFPSNHFGIILKWEDWHILKDKLVEERIHFVVEPQKVFEGEIGEQVTMMIQDPDRNIIEFKAFERDDRVFKTE